MSGDAIACIDLFLNPLFNFFCAICWQVYLLLTSPGIKVKGYFLEEGGRNKDESLYVFPSPAT